MVEYTENEREVVIDMILKKLGNLSTEELVRLIGRMDMAGLWRD